MSNNAKPSDVVSFREWLVANEGYSERTAGDAVSRLKRADKISPITSIPISYYLCDLDEVAQFEHLSVNVKSQIRRSIKLYAKYLGEMRGTLRPINRV